MATRTVRLDAEDEAALRRLRERTGLPISQALKRGLRMLESDVTRGSGDRAPYETFREMDLGPGGYAIAPSSDVRGGVRAAVRRKLKR